MAQFGGEAGERRTWFSGPQATGYPPGPETDVQSASHFLFSFRFTSIIISFFSLSFFKKRASQSRPSTMEKCDVMHPSQSPT